MLRNTVSSVRCALLATMLMLWGSSAYGDTIRCSSLEASVVQRAVDEASAGDTILLPAGSVSWGTSTAGQPAVLIAGKAVTLQGAGEGQTVVEDTTGTSWKEAPIWIEDVVEGVVRVTGIGFGGTSEYLGVIYVDACPAFRIDHCLFQSVTGRGITTRESVGVIDNCRFVGVLQQGIMVVGDNDESWSRPLSLGTAEAVYVEDCEFLFDEPMDGALDSQYGGRYVFRRNTLHNLEMGHHGLDSVAGARSTHSFEIYGNTFTAEVSVYRAIYARGGTGVIYGNRISGTYTFGLQVANYRTCLPYSFGLCDGTNPLDGNTEGGQGYPCRDQIGRSSPASGKTAQSLQPLYEWDNLKDGLDVDVEVYTHGCTNPSPFDHIKENRDYYNDTARPGYTPYTYPHPLRLIGVPPSMPTRLRIQ